MVKKEDQDTRYYLDIDLISKKLIRFDCGNRFELSKEDLPENIVRIYITKGQFNKLKK